MIQIIIEKMSGGQYVLWVNGRKARGYSPRGQNKAREDAAMIAKVLSDMEFETDTMEIDK
jgi:hypothetical protein